MCYDGHVHAYLLPYVLTNTTGIALLKTALVIQFSLRVRLIRPSSVAFLTLHYFPIPNKWLDFGKKKKVTEHKMCFDFLYISFLQHSSTKKITQDKKCTSVFM